jgi:hypothetical protein
MAACPNCGRRTLRTKDWVCQWCGYPLLGGGYKPIDKTYRELQEERSPSFRPEEQEPEPEYKYEPEPEPEPEEKPEPRWKLNKAPRPSYQKKPQPAPEPEREADVPPRPEPRPVIRPSSPLRPNPASQPVPELAPKPQPEQLPGSRPEPAFLPKAQTAPEPPLQPVAQHKPEPPPAPQPETLTLPAVETITNGTQLTIDQIDGLFRADNIATNAALKDKVIVIKGFVNKVFIRDHLEIRYLVLTGARKVVWSARCQFDKENSAPMSRLTEGQAVALRGKYDGYGKNIIFKECSLLASN